MPRWMFIAPLLLALQACSDKAPTSSAGGISQQECDALGGKIVDGQCQKPLAKEEMKKVCDSMKLRYDEQLNGCLRD